MDLVNAQTSRSILCVRLGGAEIRTHAYSRQSRWVQAQQTQRRRKSDGLYGARCHHRWGAVPLSCSYLQKDAGWEPEALLNFVALMGASWHKSTSRSGQPLGEAMTMDEMIDNVSRSSAASRS